MHSVLTSLQGKQLYFTLLWNTDGGKPSSLACLLCATELQAARETLNTVSFSDYISKSLSQRNIVHFDFYFYTHLLFWNFFVLVMEREHFFARVSLDRGKMKT